MVMQAAMIAETTVVGIGDVTPINAIEFVINT